MTYPTRTLPSGAVATYTHGRHAHVTTDDLTIRGVTYRASLHAYRAGLEPGPFAVTDPGRVYLYRTDRAARGISDAARRDIVATLLDELNAATTARDLYRAERHARTRAARDAFRDLEDARAALAKAEAANADAIAAVADLDLADALFGWTMVDKATPTRARS